MSSAICITAICPTYNEAGFIEQVIRFFVDSGPAGKELYIIDGGSTDDTVSIAEKWARKYPFIHVVPNPDKFVPQALNIGIKMAKGKFIVRLDAHTEYQVDYFDKIIETFHTIDADIVGGPMEAKGSTTVQKAIAFATSGSFGIGNSKFHRIGFNGFTDSVYLGAWKQSLFEEVGYFDERMVRNQDDEFHYRAKSKGRKIYLNSEIKSFYFPRSDYASLFKQYFQYGLYKPLVLKKISSEIKWRHLIPLFFILYLLILPAAFEFPPIVLPLLVYVLITIFLSFFNDQPLRVKLASLLVYPILHVSYGAGFLTGLIMLNKLGSQKMNSVL